MRPPQPPVPPSSAFREPEPATLKGCLACSGLLLIVVLAVALMVLGILFVVEHM